MSSTEFQLDEFLESSPVGGFDPNSIVDPGTDGTHGVSWKEPGYEGTIDYRIRQLSYSSRLTLHSCPRKFQLYKLRSTKSSEQTISQSVTFAYGHIIGEAIQLALQDIPEHQIIFRMFTHWAPDLFDANEKQNKSFFSAVLAVKRFLSIRAAGFLSDYELVYFQGKPACELSFCINFPDGFRYRGHVDAVLRHKITGEIIVLECKTTAAKALNPATYKNSAQAIGYSIVLDSLFPDLSSYKVLYLVNQSTTNEFTPLEFTKTYLQRALWIRELLLDIEKIKMYEAAEVYPMHGESCITYSKETEKDSKIWEGDCEYLQVCTLSTEHLTKVCTPEEEDTTDYQVTLSLADLLETQLEKTS